MLTQEVHIEANWTLSSEYVGGRVHKETLQVRLNERMSQHLRKPSVTQIKAH